MPPNRPSRDAPPPPPTHDRLSPHDRDDRDINNAQSRVKSDSAKDNAKDVDYRDMDYRNKDIDYRSRDRDNNRNRGRHNDGYRRDNDHRHSRDSWRGKGGKRPCKFFEETGYCRKERDCEFYHAKPARRN